MRPEDIAAGDIDAIQKQYDKAAKQATYDKTRHSGMSVVALNQKRRATTGLTSRLWPRRLTPVALSLRAVYLIYRWTRNPQEKRGRRYSRHLALLCR